MPHARDEEPHTRCPEDEPFSGQEEDACGVLRTCGLCDHGDHGKNEQQQNDQYDTPPARRAFLEGAPEMDWKRSGLYWRFNLLVAQLLDREHWSVMQLLRHPPSQESVEAAVRKEQP